MVRGSFMVPAPTIIQMLLSHMLDCVNVCAAQNSQGVVQEILFKKQH